MFYLIIIGAFMLGTTAMYLLLASLASRNNLNINPRPKEDNIMWKVICQGFTVADGFNDKEEAEKFMEDFREIYGDYPHLYDEKWLLAVQDEPGIEFDKYNNIV